MTPAERQRQIEEIDRFLAEPKVLTEFLPHWRDSHIPGRWAAEWPILDADDVAVPGVRIVFTCKKSDTSTSNLRVLFKNNAIYGVDLVRPQKLKSNPPDAWKLNLPSTVRGSHFHCWRDNRAYALTSGVGQLPYRRPSPRLLNRLPHALAALADDINLALTPSQASFDVPPQGYLPLGGDDDL